MARKLNTPALVAAEMEVLRLTQGDVDAMVAYSGFEAARVVNLISNLSVNARLVMEQGRSFDIAERAAICARRAFSIEDTATRLVALFGADAVRAFYAGNTSHFAQAILRLV